MTAGKPAAPGEPRGTCALSLVYHCWGATEPEGKRGHGVCSSELIVSSHTLAI